MLVIKEREPHLPVMAGFLWRLLEVSEELGFLIGGEF
jgi:hypothetical protein